MDGAEIASPLRSLQPCWTASLNSLLGWLVTGPLGRACRVRWLHG